MGVEDQIIDLDTQTIKPCLTCLFLWIRKKVSWTYRRATSQSIQSWSGFILNNRNTVVMWIVFSCSLLKEVKKYKCGYEGKDTSDLSCFPKYMSEEMAFISPNFCWASPAFVTGSAFLLAVGLRTNRRVKTPAKAKLSLYPEQWQQQRDVLVVHWCDGRGQEEVGLRLQALLVPVLLLAFVFPSGGKASRGLILKLKRAP